MIAAKFPIENHSLFWWVEMLSATHGGREKQCERHKSAERVAAARGYLITLTSKDYQKQHLITGSTFTNSNIGSSKVQAEYMPIVPSASYASRKCLSKSRLKNSRRPEQICRAAMNQKKSNRISISSRRNIRKSSKMKTGKIV